MLVLSRFSSRCLLVVSVASLLSGRAASAAAESYDLTARTAAGDAADIAVELEVGGQVIFKDDEGKEEKLPLNATGGLQYHEELLKWDADNHFTARSLRKYGVAKATITSREQTLERKLPAERALVVAELTDDGLLLQGLEKPLTRNQFDLLNAVGNTLAIDRLLPGKSLAEGDSWRHDEQAIKGLLGIDEATVCEVSSVVEGVDDGQVQLRLAGSLQGVIDGSETEMELKGAYLFAPTVGRIVKLNLAVKEQRQPGLVSPGLDVTAKLTLELKGRRESTSQEFSSDELSQARRQDFQSGGKLVIDSPQRGYRFRHGAHWYVFEDPAKRELMAMRMVESNRAIAHCRITTLPARSAGRETSLKQYETSIRKSLKDNIDEIAAAKEWTTPTGHRCQAVFANGKMEDVPVQWRYYLVSSPGLPRVSVAVTVEQSLLEKFADADRAIVDSLELIAPPAAETAAKPDAAKSAAAN